MKLSRIQKVNPREVWKHEALDFTRWLVKENNISILSEVTYLGTPYAQVQKLLVIKQYNPNLVLPQLEGYIAIMNEDILPPFHYG